jgi:hypothetical protein
MRPLESEDIDSSGTSQACDAEFTTTSSLRSTLPQQVVSWYPASFNQLLTHHRADIAHPRDGGGAEGTPSLSPLPGL